MARRESTRSIAVLIVGLGLVGLGCQRETAESRGAEPPVRTDATAPDAAALAAQARSIFGPLPEVAASADNPITDAKVELGRLLYYEPRLSKSQEISCNSCHQLDRFGVDGEPTSPGHRGQRGDRNSPSTYNAALHVAQFWDGRAAHVEEQATGPMMNPVEMAMVSPQQVVAVLESMPEYVALFEAAFPGTAEPISLENAGIAIGAFERGLLTPGPFDRFMEGDLGALTPAQQRGLETFIATGCITCHNGPGVGGAMFQKLGLVHPYETEDPGRFKVTGAEADRYVFKVPSLRNVAQTGPWFHDGSITSLDEAVRLMAWHQLGRELDEARRRDLLAFLGSLTGEVDARYVTAPKLPPSTDATPPPDPS